MKDESAESTKRISLTVEEWKRVANAVVRLMELLPDDQVLKRSSSIKECARWAVVIDEIDELARTVAQVTQKAVDDQVGTVRRRASSKGSHQ